MKEGEPKQMTTREEQARTEVGHTAITGPGKWTLTVAFLGLISVVPVVQLGRSVADHAGGQGPFRVPQPFAILTSLPEAWRAAAQAEGSVFTRAFSANRVLLRDVNEYEDDLEEQSCVGARIRPPAQLVLARWLGSGNEQSYVGRGGWLFYRPDFDYVTGPGFLAPRQLRRRAGQGSEVVEPPQPDPRKAILQFREQLKARGITLVVMPTPVKPVVHPERLARRRDGWRPPVQNPSYARFKQELVERGVLVFDPALALAETNAETGAPQFLLTDTHWRPEAMERVASKLAEFVGAHVELPSIPAPKYRRHAVEVRHLGDLATLLDLPGGQTAFPPEEVEIHQVRQKGGYLWREDPEADVLVLGDSFSNIYSFEAMGWGEAGGFVEQLAFEMQRPLDRIVRNADGAFATRQILSHELARGRDRLEGQRLVVWQFAARELSFGDWKLLPMKLGTPPEGNFVVPRPGEEKVVTGTIAAISAAPRPGTVPYRDHIVVAHLVDLESQGAPIRDGQAVVRLWSMRDNRWTPAARYRPGDRITVRLRPWRDVARKLARINWSGLDDVELQLQEHNWGEVVDDAGTTAGERGREPWPMWVMAAVLTLCLAARLWDAVARRRSSS